jgi:hypothetical protein
MAALAERRAELSRRANEETLANYKWTVAGVLLSIPAPFVLGLRGMYRFHPLLLLGSAGSIVDMAQGYNATLPLRKDAGALEQLLNTPNSMPLRRDAVRKGWLDAAALHDVPPSHPDAIEVVTVSTMRAHTDGDVAPNETRA